METVCEHPLNWRVQQIERESASVHPTGVYESHTCTLFIALLGPRVMEEDPFGVVGGC